MVDPPLGTMVPGVPEAITGILLLLIFSAANPTINRITVHDLPSRISWQVSIIV